MPLSTHSNPANRLWIGAALVGLALVCAPRKSDAAELLTNGGFDDIGAATPESWGGLTYYAGGPLLPGWTVESGSVDLTTTGSFWGPAYDGAYSLDINGWDAGRLSQSFATVLGQIYNVSFAFSRNVAGAPDPATATVSAGGRSFDVSAANDGSFGSGYAMRWQTASFSFTGNGSPTSIVLAATQGGNGGVFFDKVSVATDGIRVAAVPEPAMWTLTILGFGLTGAALRRQRALAVVRTR